MTDTATIGHNSGAQFADVRRDIEQRIAAFLKGGDVWAKREKLDDADAAKANDFITGVKKLASDAEKARVAEKEPHLESGRAVDREWKQIAERIDAIAAIVKPKLDAYLRAKQEEQRRAEAEARRLAAEAEANARAAAADAAAAETPSAQIEAEARARAHQEAADEAARQAERNAAPVRVGSATGLAHQRGFKTVRKPSIKSMPQALAHYRDEPDLEALILKLAARDLREAPTRRGVKQIPAIPGIEFVETQELA
jgi:hypothetical protein